MLPFSNLKPLFEPKNIAIIGASAKPQSVGFSLINNLFQNGFAGNIYPVNPNYQQIYGQKCFPTILKVPEIIDLAIIATPSDTVPEIVKHCGQAHVKTIIIVSSGFKEIGGVGQKYFQEIEELVKKYPMRILGPNCMGIMRPKINLNATFTNNMTKSGNIAFISQSGALGTAILDWAVTKNIGFSTFISIGEMADIDFGDIITYLKEDPDTKSILLYLESLTNPHKFLKICQEVGIKKPIICFKSGKTDLGAKAILSHTGNLTGNDAVYNTAFKQAQILRVNTISELFDTAKILESQKFASNNRLTIITNAGGPGVIATDYLLTNSGQLATLNNSTIKLLNEVLPKAWSHNNPIDILGDADPNRYQNALNCCITNNEIDNILVILTPQYMTSCEEIAKIISLASKNTKKLIMTSFMGGNLVAKAIKILEENKIPQYENPESAVKAFLNLVSFSKNKKSTETNTPYSSISFSPKIKANKSLIQNILKSKRTILTENEAKTILANYDLPIPDFEIVTNIDKAQSAAKKIGYPVAMKILSPDILHKTDVGGYKLNLINKQAVIKAYQEIEDNIKKFMPHARITGFLIEKMISKRYELLLGSKTDAIFGPVIAFGTGGVMVEYYKDVAFSLPPLDMAKAKKLIKETKIFELLNGYRGLPKINFSDLEQILCKFSRLITDFPEIKEIDINPLAIDKQGAVILDAKIILNDKIISDKIYWGKGAS